uniref:Auxin-responsive protein n=1 Tax=Zea mays TaxID=4577 RepID=A0A804MYK9_MAIZE
MAWRGPLGAGEEALDSGLELSLGLPAYFARPSGLDAAREEPAEASAYAIQAASGSNVSKARVRPAGAAPVVGWPPVRSFRRNLAASSSRPSSGKHTRQEGSAKDGLFVKINMDGVPIGRKVDLTAYGGYADLSAAVGKLFRGLLAEGPSGHGGWRGGGGGGGPRDRRRLHAGVRGRRGRQGPCRRRPLGLGAGGPERSAADCCC